MQRQYTYGHMILSQRLRLAEGWAVRFYSADGHGSIRQLTDEAGAVTDTYTYDAFGRLISRIGTTPNPYLYAGERFDEDLGLYYLRACHYDADRGRFFSMDPYPGGTYDPVSLHKYLYAHADPINFTDPSGLSEFGEYVVVLRANLYLAARLVAKRAGLAVLQLSAQAETNRDLICRILVFIKLSLPFAPNSLQYYSDGVADFWLDAAIEHLCLG